MRYRTTSSHVEFQHEMPIDPPDPIPPQDNGTWKMCGSVLGPKTAGGKDDGRFTVDVFWFWESSD